MLLSFDYIPPPTLSGLTIIPSSSGMSFTWINPIDASLWAVEIWEASTNDRSTASLLDTITGTNSYEYISLNTGVITHYFWIRAVGTYGQNNGNWYPTSSTAGISGTSGTVGTVDITASAVTTTTIITSLAAVANTTAYNHWGTILSTNKTGSDVPVLFDTELEIKAMCALAGANNAALLKYSLINTSSGGSDFATDVNDTSFTTTKKYDPDPGAGSGDWLDIRTNGTVADGVFGTATANAIGLKHLLVYFFDFASIIPEGASLLSVQVRIVGKYASGTGVPTLNVDLCWDAEGFPTEGGSIISTKSRKITLSTTNTSYTLGGMESIQASWGNVYDSYTSINSPIDMSNIVDPTFGIRIRDMAPSNGRVISIDHIAFIVYYSTRDIIFEVVKSVPIDALPANSAITNTIQNKIAATLTNGSSYTYAVEWLMAVDNYVGNTWVSMSRNNLITTIQEFKR